ncbi:MAG: trypsin-like serine protease [Ruminococcaceae bacterium]|nr:trypsin-like serine protease [Oscillospiraceae bacterium]
MDERKDVFEFEAVNSDINAKDVDGDSVENEEIKIYESKYTVGEGGWFPDDFEDVVRNAVPKDRAISIYRPKEKKFRKLIKSPLFAAVLSSVITCILCLTVFTLAMIPVLKDEDSVLPQTQSPDIARPVVNQSQGAEMGIPEVYDKASPSVVSITCKAAGNYMSSQAMSSGSGIIIRSDGYIVTNNHVIEGASSITVTTIAGQTFDAKVVGADARTDLAVLKVETEAALSYAELGNSSEIRVGELAIAIGNPLREELAGTLTVGYISAINRTMVIDGKQLTMIQTDAAINPGNSGGALLNSRGQLIGINTAKSTGYDVEGLGFAIPINEAKPIIEAIIKNGYVTGRPLVGIVGRTITEAAAKANGLPTGVYVVEVTEYGAAERAGIRVGDVIIRCEGEDITTIDEINEIKDKHKPGEVITFKVVRNGEKKDIKVTLQEEKPTAEKKPEEQTPEYEYQIPSDFFPWFGW